MLSLGGRRHNDEAFWILRETVQLHALTFSGEGTRNIIYLQARRLKFDGRLADPVRINRGRPLIRRVRAYSANDTGSR